VGVRDVSLTNLTSAGRVGWHARLDPGTLLGQLARGGAWALAARVLAVLTALVASVVLARVLGPRVYGTYPFLFAVASIAAVPLANQFSATWL